MIKVALCQSNTVGTPQENVALIRRMVETAVRDGNVDIAVFPEDSYFDVDAADPSKLGKPEDLNGFFVTQMRELAQKYHVNLIPGTFHRLAENGKYYNTELFINRNGDIIGQYDKIHLMKAMNYDESESVEAGNSPAVFDTDIGRVGLMVCYDLRFPELARGMVQEGANIIFVPAFWPAGNPLPPRTDHWDTLVNCTALINQTYVVAVNQYGHMSAEIPFGRSCVVDPWGTVIAQCPNRVSIAYAELDMDYQEEVRQKLATWTNRRPDCYTLH